MKSQTHTTTPIATVPWMRWSATMLAALLALAGLTFALGRSGWLSNGALKDAAASPSRPLVAVCRVCADEVLGAAQASQGSMTTSNAGSAVSQRAAVPRVFRDEILGADQANLAFLSSSVAGQPPQTKLAVPVTQRPV